MMARSKSSLSSTASRAPSACPTASSKSKPPSAPKPSKAIQTTSARRCQGLWPPSRQRRPSGQGRRSAAHHRGDENGNRHPRRTRRHSEGRSRPRRRPDRRQRPDDRAGITQDQSTRRQTARILMARPCKQAGHALCARFPALHSTTLSPKQRPQQVPQIWARHISRKAVISSVCCSLRPIARTTSNWPIS